MTRPKPYRIYSKQGDDKAYLRIEADGSFAFVRSWRDATAWDSRGEAKEVLERARAALPARPMCIVVYGTRSASLPPA